MGRKKMHTGDIVKGLAAGMIAGVAATGVMTVFQNAWLKTSKSFGGNGAGEGDSQDSGGSEPGRKTGASKGGTSGGSRKKAGTKAASARGSSKARSVTETAVQSGPESNGHDSEDGANAPEKFAEKIAGTVFHKNLTEPQRKTAGEMVHYGFGALYGAGYGVMAEAKPETTTGFGALYGTATWLGSDEIMVPLLGLSKGPTKYPLSVHAYSLASHLVYGCALELTRRVVRRVL